MANVLHKTADPVDYRRSVNTPDFPAGTWFRNPDISAVSGVDKKYWKRPLTDPVAEMSQGEKDAVDAAEAAAELASRRAATVGEVDASHSEGVRARALIELLNKRDNYIINRLIQVENALAAFMESLGNAQVGRTAAKAQAAQPFPQAQTVDATANFARIVTRPKSDAIQDYKDDINAGNQDT